MSVNLYFSTLNFNVFSSPWEICENIMRLIKVDANSTAAVLNFISEKIKLPIRESRTRVASGGHSGEQTIDRHFPNKRDCCSRCTFSIFKIVSVKLLVYFNCSQRFLVVLDLSKQCLKSLSSLSGHSYHQEQNSIASEEFQDRDDVFLNDRTGHLLPILPDHFTKSIQ